MFDSSVSAPPIVFLHIPKTAGQTVHNELARAVGQNAVSPVRVHTQATAGEGQFPPNFRLYSGHIDWDALDAISRPRFVFSILRDPKERIASFYFYLLKEAEALSPEALCLPRNAGKRAALELSTDDYFFAGNAAWQLFIQDHYDNFYCRYFGSRKVRAGKNYSDMPHRRQLRAAMRNIDQIDWIYGLDQLEALESDLKALYGFELDFNGNRTNLGDRPVSEPRWPRLLERLEHDRSRAKLERFVEIDLSLMERLEL